MKTECTHVFSPGQKKKKWNMIISTKNGTNIERVTYKYLLDLDIWIDEKLTFNDLV